MNPWGQSLKRALPGIFPSCFLNTLEISPPSLVTGPQHYRKNAFKTPQRVCTCQTTENLPAPPKFLLKILLFLGALDQFSSNPQALPSTMKAVGKGTWPRADVRKVTQPLSPGREHEIPSSRCIHHSPTSTEGGWDHLMSQRGFALSLWEHPGKDLIEGSVRCVAPLRFITCRSLSPFASRSVWEAAKGTQQRR